MSKEPESWHSALLFFLPLVIVLLTPACISHTQDVRSAAIESCISLCIKAKNDGVNLTSGPCLSDGNPEWKVEDWVCDVAHWPRQDVDNQAENQCKSFREGRAHHFVEVDEYCKLIRVY